MSNEFIYTVTILNKRIKYVLDKVSFFSNITIKGEISNFKKHSRGHLYFTLKDENSQVDAIMFQSQASKLTFEPKDGSKVIIKASLTVFEQMGKYQLNVVSMNEEGLGDLYQKFLELKDKLEKKGYFIRKRPIPKYPKRIGVITSSTGSVIRDIINTVNRRYPICEIILYDTLVQGEYAKDQIVKQIKQANIDNYVDVLILGRGGGSLEDLWPFNEEIVADAIFNSKLPIISAVGHETDFTISDFTSDLRAPTPTAAAELATPNIKELLLNVFKEMKQLNKNYDNYLNNTNQKLLFLDDKLMKFNPLKILQDKKQKTYNNYNNLNNYFNNYFLTYKNKLNLNYQLILRNNPLNIINNKEKEVIFIHTKLNNYYKNILNNKINNYNNLINKLELLNPLKIMDKGYSIIKKDNKIIKSSKDLKINDIITINLKDGLIESKIIKKGE